MPLPSFVRRIPLLVLSCLALSSPVAAQTVMVVGSPHLSQLDPVPDTAQLDAAVAALARYAPTQVCIEAMPGERIEALAAEPGHHGELLRGQAGQSLQLGQRMQNRLSVRASDARDQAREAAARWSSLDAPGRLRLIALQLAGYELWSALLNWSQLDASERAGAKAALGAATVARLDELSSSPNEIVGLAISIARKQGHHALCAVDSMIDELRTQALAPDLMPLIARPEVMQPLQAFQAESAAVWQAGDRNALVNLLRWYNGEAFPARDRATQWEVFRNDAAPHDAGSRRLMFWHARNADVAAGLFRALAQPSGRRVMLIIGGAHRPFLEAALRAQPWVEVVGADTLLSAKSR